MTQVARGLSPLRTPHLRHSTVSCCHSVSNPSLSADPNPLDHSLAIPQSSHQLQVKPQLQSSACHAPGIIQQFLHHPSHTTEEPLMSAGAPGFDLHFF